MRSIVVFGPARTKSANIPNFAIVLVPRPPEGSPGSFDGLSQYRDSTLLLSSRAMRFVKKYSSLLSESNVCMSSIRISLHVFEAAEAEDSSISAAQALPFFPLVAGWLSVVGFE